MQLENIKKAISILCDGGVIAYPTESVFGLGCDPDNESALLKLLRIKNRSSSKGMLMVSHDFSLVTKYINFTHIDETDLMYTKEFWPGPFTFLFPASDSCSQLLKGNHSTIAIRISTHPIIKALCSGFNKPIVSTSANISGNPPCVSLTDVHTNFDNIVNFIVDGETLNYSKPSTIIDLKTKIVLRS